METLLIKRLKKEHIESHTVCGELLKNPSPKSESETHLGFIVNTSTDVWHTRVTGCH